MNEKFFSLPIEKQEQIVNAAFTVFSKHSYKCANTEEIAQLAGISKGLLFYYFTNKKSLYTYINSYGINVMYEELKDKEVLATTDFFELMIQGQTLKFDMMRAKPELCAFLMKAYIDNEEVVQEGMQAYYHNLFDTGFEDILATVDTYKFKNNIRLETVLNLILWSAEGFIRAYGIYELTTNTAAISEKYMEVIEMMRQHFYKEEYL